MKRYFTITLWFVFAAFLLMTACGENQDQETNDLNGTNHTKETYAWVLVETISNADEVAYERKDEVRNAYPYAWEEKIEVSENELIHSLTYLGSNYADHDDVRILAHHAEGNHITRKVTWSAPPSILGDDEEVIIQVVIETIEQGLEDAIPLRMNAEAGTRLFQGDRPTTSTYFVDKQGNEGVFSSDDNDYASLDTALYGKMGKGNEDGELRAVWISSYLGSNPYTNLYVMYTYKWQKR